MEEKFKERILNLSDNDLLDLYEVCYLDYRAEALEYAKEEILKRNIKKKVWFYNDLIKEYGPYSRDEIAGLIKIGDIKYNFNIWHEGMSNWVELRHMNIPNIKELFDDTHENELGIKPPPINSVLSNQIDDEKYDEGKNSGVKVAGILTIVSGSLWILIAMSQLFIAVTGNDVGFYVQAGWNTVVSIAIIVIGQGILKMKSWGYSWGVGTSGLNAALNIFLLISIGPGLNIFFIILDLAVFILLLRNKQVFEYAKENKVKDH